MTTILIKEHCWLSKVQDSKSIAHLFESHNQLPEKYLLVLLDKALYLRVVLDKDIDRIWYPIVIMNVMAP